MSFLMFWVPIRWFSVGGDVGEARPLGIAQNPKSKGLLVKLGLPGREQTTRPAPTIQQLQKLREAQPPGIAVHSASTASDIAVSSGEAGPSWPRANGDSVAFVLNHRKCPRSCGWRRVRAH